MDEEYNSSEREERRFDSIVSTPDEIRSEASGEVRWVRVWERRCPSLGEVGDSGSGQGEEEVGRGNGEGGRRWGVKLHLLEPRNFYVCI